MISNSGSDERGKLSGGQAGDQTGTEWQIRPWYNRPWTHVLRHPDAKVREELAKLAEWAANNNLIGYDQGQRYTYRQHLKASGWDPRKITVKCEADCSSGVITNVEAVGHRLGITKLQRASSVASYTGDMRLGLKGIGFEVLTASKYLTSDKYLLRGDILLKEGSHTATNLTNGSLSGASTPSTPAPSTPSTPTTTDTKYTVKKGDSTSAIAKKFGVTVDNLVNWNNIKDKNIIYVGQVLVVKKPSTTVTTQGKFNVKVSIGDLNIRAGAGTSYKAVRKCPIGVYTITETRTANGHTWGKLLSGAGWIALEHAKRI